MYDALIVGGSLAGTATAVHLARRGCRVVILERSSAPQRKACGEGLFPRGVEELRRLGVAPGPEASPDDRGSGAPLTGVRFHAGRYSASATFQHERGGIGVRRDVLDARLRETALAAGAELRMGVAARSLVRDGARFSGVETDTGEVVSARVLVGADGLRSRVRQRAGLDRQRRQRRYGVSAHLELRAPPEPFVDVHFDDGVEVYVTPVGGLEVNVAVLARRSGMQRFAGGVTAGFRSLLRDHPALAGARLVDHPKVAGPFPASSRRPWRDNLVLVGDAAGFADAISGEGMSTGLVGARDCAEAVSDYLVHGDPRAFRRYATRRRRLVRNADLLARLSLALSATPSLARHSVRNMGRQPATFERLVRVSAGELRLRDLRPRDLLALAVGA